MTDVTKQLADAADALLQIYVSGVNSGDWGNWDPEKDDEVINLRAALDACRHQSCDLGPICLGCDPKEECKPDAWQYRVYSAEDGDWSDWRHVENLDVPFVKYMASTNENWQMRPLYAEGGKS